MISRVPTVSFRKLMVKRVITLGKTSLFETTQPFVILFSTVTSSFMSFFKKIGFLDCFHRLILFFFIFRLLVCLLLLFFLLCFCFCFQPINVSLYRCDTNGDTNGIAGHYNGNTNRVHSGYHNGTASRVHSRYYNGTANGIHDASIRKPGSSSGHHSGANWRWCRIFRTARRWTLWLTFFFYKL